VTVPADAALNRAFVNHLHIAVSARSGAATITACDSSRSLPAWHPPFLLRVGAHSRRPFPVAMIDIAIGVYFIVFVGSKGW
jgi:hypothetical protein